MAAKKIQTEPHGPTSAPAEPMTVVDKTLGTKAKTTPGSVQREQEMHDHTGWKTPGMMPKTSTVDKKGRPDTTRPPHDPNQF